MAAFRGVHWSLGTTSITAEGDVGPGKTRKAEFHALVPIVPGMMIT